MDESSLNNIFRSSASRRISGKSSLYRKRKKIFRSSSAVEQCAVNALAVGSNPTSGARQRIHPCGGFFVLFGMRVNRLRSGRCGFEANEVSKNQGVRLRRLADDAWSPTSGAKKKNTRYSAGILAILPPTYLRLYESRIITPE